MAGKDTREKESGIRLKKRITRESYLMAGKRCQGKGIRYQIKKKRITRESYLMFFI